MEGTKVFIGTEEYRRLVDDSAILRLVIGYLVNDTGYSTADDLRKFLSIADPNKKKAETAATETANI